MSAIDLKQDVKDERRPLARRDTWLAVKRGLRNRCPACGEGHILHRYLKVHDACPSCGEELHHHRADDFPPYVTMIVVGHVLAGTMLFVDEMWPNLPLAVHFSIWPLACVLMCLWLLPMFKGALIAYQWALRMHGFETAHHVAAPSTPAVQRSVAA